MLHNTKILKKRFTKGLDLPSTSEIATNIFTKKLNNYWVIQKKELNSF